MSNATYQTFILLPPQHPLTFEQLLALLQARFAKLKAARDVVKASDNTIQITNTGWTLTVSWEADAHVVAESADMAAYFGAKRADQERIATCPVRLVTSGDPDPEMAFFNDYVFALEVLEALEDVYILDMAAETLHHSSEPWSS